MNKLRKLFPFIFIFPLPAMAQEISMYDSPSYKKKVVVEYCLFNLPEGPKCFTLLMDKDKVSATLINEWIKDVEKKHDYRIISR